MAGTFMVTLLVSVFYSAEPLPLWHRGLEGNPHLLVNINISLNFGWLLCLILGRRECHLSLVLLGDRDLLWISFLLAH